MSYYLEDPFGRITNVHWKKKDDDPLPPGVCIPTPRFDNHYGHQAFVVQRPPNILTVAGNFSGPPFVGSFRTDMENWGADGSSYGGIGAAPWLPPTMSAEWYNQHAGGLSLLNDHMLFSDLQLINMSAGHFDDPTEVLYWRVPMVGGTNSVCRPYVIKTYEITMYYESSLSRGMFGIGITHPLNHQMGPPNKPKRPAVYGSGSAGSLSFSYDWQWLDWLMGRIIITPANFDDPSVGGPAMLWAMSEFAGSWTASNTWFTGGMRRVGDTYSWQIRSTIELQPDFSLGFSAAAARSRQPLSPAMVAALQPAAPRIVLGGGLRFTR